MKNLYKFHWDCGSMGMLDGLFIAIQEEVDAIIGKEIYFGEVLGKHSEIYGTIKNSDIVNLNADSDTIDKLFSILGNTLCGYNPVDFYGEQ